MAYRRIRDLREDHDLKQRQLAEYLRCSQQTYSDYENGKVDVPTQVLIALAIGYQTTTDYLLGLSNQRQPPAGQQETGKTGCLTRMEKSRPKMKGCCDRKHGESGQQGANGPENRT